LISVTKIFTFEDFLDLSSDWRILLNEQRSDNTPFYTHEWFQCWWKSFGRGVDFFIILVKEENKLIGIAPMMLKKIFMHGLPVRQLSFIENGNSLHNNFILGTRRKKDVLERIIQYLITEQSCWDVVELKNIPAESENCVALKELLYSNKILFGQKDALNSPYITLGSDWETFYKSRSSKAKKTLRNIQNRFKKSGSFIVHKIDNYEEFKRVKPELYDIAKNSWTEEVGDSLYSEKNMFFFDELSRFASERGWLAIWLLQLNGESIAFEYHLRYQGRVYGMRASHKKNCGNMSPGVFLDYHIIKQLFENGDIKEYDLGGSSDFYKRKWTEESRSHVLINIFKKSFYSRLLYMYEYKLIPAIKNVVRKPA